MTTTLKAIQALYVKIGGSLTDTYDGIAGGASISDYSLITDALKAIFVKCGGNLSTVYSDINSAPVSGYSLNPDVISAIAKVAQIPVLSVANVTPTTSAQTITPQTGNGFSQINVSAVTAAIDANIVAENIKKDVTILGVVGTYEAAPAEQSQE